MLKVNENFQMENMVDLQRYAVKRKQNTETIEN